MLSYGPDRSARRAWVLGWASLLQWALALAAPQAVAVDGVAEINHACAALTGCFPGDAAGYPVTIDGSAGGSYRLTGNLVVPDENTDGIAVSAPRTSIDLNGFEIVRSGCEGATTDCVPASGTGSGVQADLVSGVAVKNGSITGMGSNGVQTGIQAEVSGLRVHWNRLVGIDVDSYSRVENNLVYGNGDDGIDVGGGSLVSGNVASANGGDGIEASLGAAVQRNTAIVNTGVGLRLSPSAAYLENSIAGNATGSVVFGLDVGGNSCSGGACP